MPRLSIQIPDELDKRLDKFLPWGTKQRVMLHLAEQLCNAVDSHGRQILTAFMTNEYSVITKELTNAPTDTDDHQLQSGA